MATNAPDQPCPVCGGKLEWEIVEQHREPWEPVRFGPTEWRQMPHTCPPEAVEKWAAKVFEAGHNQEPFFKSVQEQKPNTEAIYRDIFAEITAKAIPVTDPSSDDPERVRHYIVPVGPIHRAAGKVGFQMFNGEQHLNDAIARIRELEAPQSGPIDAEKIARLKGVVENLDDLDKQRTPGPWKKTHDNITVGVSLHLVARCDADWNSFKVDMAKASKNARFIVALENAWPLIRQAIARLVTGSEG